MTTAPSQAEIALIRDLERLGEQVREDWFAVELYRALAGRRWRRRDAPGVVNLSWRRAEQIVDDLRRVAHAPQLSLAQQGGEGQLSDDVERALGERGWVSEPEDTDERDPAHTDAAPDLPPQPDPAPTQWEREAHEAAHRERVRKV
jgi:hypothetical protein